MSSKYKKKESKSRSRSKSSIISEIMYPNKKVLYPEERKFFVKTSKIMGRYMVAKKDILPGEIILSELPIVVGPCAGCAVQCLGCYKNLEEESFVKCKSCNWPLCSYECSGINKRLGHSDVECAILRKTNSSKFLNYNDFSNIRSRLCAIVPLRCLILKKVDPKTYDLLLNMEHHNELRMNISEVWNNNQKNVVDTLIDDWGLTCFSEEEIHTVCGILEINCFEIGQQDRDIRGLYPTAFLMSHDCVPNTNHSDEETNYQLTVRASTEIKEGHPVTLSYAYTLQNTMKRREHLLDNKFFECYCKRCSDPSELGSYCSALQCPKCQSGLVLCDDPLNFDSPWSCTNTKKCPGYSITAKSMKLLLNRITQEADQINSNDVNSMELFLDKYRNVLHPTHYICLGMKISLCQIYGKVEGNLIYQLGDEMLERKIEICREVLGVLDVIEPGYSRIRGVTLYELHAPLMILLTRKLAGKSVTKLELKSRLKEISKCLTEATVILSYEPENSAEGNMGKAAAEALIQIKDWKKIVGKF
ncbi:SET domain-containing protein SmydA-8-like isoform X1 [Diorhabda sublineata]|uniref:SET domain-containing protein SmydA-8-like isoform X1 n=2 Tax=Diorhabda sublineata TaxID=1163346 RepID=UPI0024E07C9E|nr:SET domain-containing protein SmydA-8-like isoform X1 [Diorhabda sublineata]